MPRSPALRLATALLLTLCTASAAAQSVAHTLATTTFADARAALEDAIAAEGIAPPTVHDFGAMLRRTAPDLGHPPDLYGDAITLTFCSAPLAARLAAEDPAHIALCPLSIALHTLPADPARIHLSYRRPTTGTPAGELAEHLLERIAARTARSLGLR